MADEALITNTRPKRLASTRRFQTNQAFAKQEIRKKLRKVSIILKKKEAERTEDEIDTLHQLPDVVKTAEKNATRKRQQNERIMEIEDEPDVLNQKCQELAEMLLSAKSAIVYTGAGISTAASIPDYRGPNGVWTLLRKGQSLSAQDLVDADPTYTHMCITKLYKLGKVKYLVSQNCDGLHMRSGFPRHSMSEVHGNMFIEICKKCKPQKQYIRLFDVTERTAKGRHKTGRTCNKCGDGLLDSIVHFGEKGGLKAPYRWREAFKAASKADLIICLGSSLKVLRRYACLWRMDIRPEQRPKLVIVNLQWTPKDEQATLKIHGRCDDVLRKLAQHICLFVPAYRRETDPLFRLHTPVLKGEEHFANMKTLKIPAMTSIEQQKAFHNVPKGVSAQQPPLLKVDCHQERNTDVSPLGTAHSSQAFKPRSNFVDHVPKIEGAVSRIKGKHVQLGFEPIDQGEHSMSVGTMPKNKLAPLAQANCAEKKSFSHLVTDSDNRASPSSAVGCETRHIPYPLRVKLEQFLKDRGVMNSSAGAVTNGRTHSTESRPPASASAPLPSIHNFLHQHEGERGTQQHSHPNLRRLLNSVPLQSLSNVDQEVFRVDLSTSPISISTTHCSPDAAASPCSWMTLDAAEAALAAHGPNAHTTIQISISNYANLVHKIHFDHSYSKPSHKAPTARVQNIGGSCSSNAQVCPQGQGSRSSSAVSVIPSSSQDHPSTNQNRSEQMFASSLQSQHKDSNCNPQFCDPGLDVTTPVSGTPQDRVVVNLNADTALALHTTPAQSRVPTMQNQHTRGAGSTQPSVSSRDCDPTPTGTMQGESSDEDLENLQTSGRKKKPVSVPGWFGKGLRIKKKRTA